MKRNIFLGLLFVALISACKAPVPKNQAEELEHDEPERVELIFTPGDLAQSDIENNVYGKGFQAKEGSEPIVINYEKDEETGAVSLDKPEGLAFMPNQWYSLQVNLYNHAGANINTNISSFAAQVNAHQFYFRHFVGKENVNDKFISYRYGDLDNSGNLVMPPLGFIGYMRFSELLPQDSRLNVILVHLIGMPKTQAKGKPYPFYAPPTAFVYGADLNYQIPIKLQ